MSVMIGLETHVQLKSASKLFCGCRNPVTYKGAGELKPNTFVCPTCLGFPGSKPRLNSKIVDFAISAALALNCKIAPSMYFSRKTYFYPDMGKNFQITQYEVPIASEGIMEISVGGKKKKIRIRRIHIEEDPAKLIHMHDGGREYTKVDYNRSGVPLIEIVTEPDFETPEEAREYLTKLGQILEYLGIYDFSLEASMKSDANLSVFGGDRVETKNITGVKEVQRALRYEHIRQNNMHRFGKKIEMESRLWDPVGGVTKRMRRKESEADYGYIFEPDLPVIENEKEKILQIKKSLPELPDEKRIRFVKQYQLHESEAEKLASEKELADLFETAAKVVGVKIASGWVAGALKKTLNYNNLSFRKSGVKGDEVIKVLKMFKKGDFTDHVTETVLQKIVESGRDADSVIKELGLKRIDDKKIIETVILKILAEEQRAVDDYLGGAEKSLNYLIGKVMRETRGQVDAGTAKKSIVEAIKNQTK